MVNLLGNYVNGEWIDTGFHYVNINPVNGKKVCDVSEADQATVDLAVKAARAAMNGEWGRMSAADRSALLHKVADRTYPHARGIDIPRGAANFRIFADLINAYPNEAYETATPDGGVALNYSHRRPLGVVAVIAPWDLPLLLLSWKVAPAMAAGNAVIAKPSEDTPTTATLLAEVMAEAGVPAGAFNLVHGFGPNSAGEFLTTHPGIDGITFTGESHTGAVIMKAAAELVKPVSFELGGKNPAVVFADCDFDAAVAGITQAAFTNGGQICMCTERVYVERPIFDRFVRALKEKAEAQRRVLLLDANPDFASDKYPQVLTDANVVAGSPAFDWHYNTEDAARLGHDVPVLSGRVTGGSSAVSATVAMRARPSDFARWAKRGIEGWSWQEVLAAYKAMENTPTGDDAWHGRCGPFPIRQRTAEENTPSMRAFVEASEAVGLANVSDFNGGTQHGVGPYPLNVVDGRRINTGIAYLTAAVRARPNLTIRGDAEVDRIVIEGKRAVGAKRVNGEILSAGEVILAAGTFGSPAILMRSGVGPSQHLPELGIATIADLPVATGCKIIPSSIMSML